MFGGGGGGGEGGGSIALLFVCPAPPYCYKARNVVTTTPIL